MNSPAPIATHATPPRVLVIDDDESVQIALTNWLQHDGCESEIARNVAEAERVLAAREFDALVCDVNLPDGSGPELIAKLRGANRGVPVIFLTGQPTVETAIRSLELRAVGYVVKPPDILALRELLHREVAAHRQRRAIATSRSQLREWDQALEQIERALETPGRSTGVDYLHVTVAHLAAQLVELDRSISLLAAGQSGRAALSQLDLIAALRRAVQVLEKTREHFKSKDLGELRKDLESLLRNVDAHVPPA